MAYTRTPMQDTYQTKQVPLIYEWDSRIVSDTGAVDPKQTIAKNVYFELVESNKTGEAYYNVIKRDGVVISDTIPNNILGIYYWEYVDRIVVVTQSNIYQVSTTTGIVTTTVTGAFAGADAALYGVNFTEFLYESGSIELIVASGNGNFGTYTAGGVYTPCTDPDRPTQIRGYPVFLDGYLFFTNIDGNLYNSDLNAPLSWTASNFISVESYPDFTQAIVRVGNYIAALGTASIEWFYDAGNPTGTPLARVDGATQQIGFLQGLISTENAAYFVGKANQGAPSVYKIDGLKVMEVGSPTVRRWLNTTSIVPNSRGHIIVMGGHRFYVVMQNRDQSAITQTYMLDLDNNMWSSLVLRQDTEGPFIFTSATVLQKSLTGRTATFATYFSEYNSTNLWTFASYQYQDTTSDLLGLINFTCEFVTRPLDFGNYRDKFCSRMVFGTDQTSATSLMYASWSDNDMASFTAPRSFDVSKVYTPLWACGNFRKRSFKLTYTDNFRMRWRSVEIDYNQGQA